MVLNLTEHQQIKLNEGIQILKTSNRLLIRGSAGVGKTFLVDQLVKTLILNSIIRSYKKILCSAPTHKAVSVLKGKIVSTSIEFATIHSILKLKQSINKDGTISFIPSFDDRFPPLQGVGLLVVDECSMLSTELIKYIEEYASENHTKVIFLGDDKQLNPVEEEESPVFFQNYPQIELTEIVRQGEGNPIITLSRNLGDIWKGQDNVVEPGLGYLYSNDKEYILSKLAEVNGSDQLKYLAWTNKEVDLVNFIVRKRIYTNPNKVELGESIVFNSPYGETYFTNEEVKVNSLDIDNVPINVKLRGTRFGSNSDQYIETSFKLYIVNGIRINDSWSKNSIKIVHEDSEKEFKEISSKLKESCKNKLLEWPEYYRFLAIFADFKYNHALTVHKSQGSTYEKVVINVRDINLNKNTKELSRLFYTAITRASKLIILYNI